MKYTDVIIFDFAGTLVKMRPATLLIDKKLIVKLASKYKLGILTGGKRSEVLNIISKLDLEKYFPKENILTKDDTQLRKPNPQLLLGLIKKLKSKNAIYTGDTVKDIKMSLTAGVTFLEPGKLVRLEGVNR